MNLILRCKDFTANWIPANKITESEFFIALMSLLNDLSTALLVLEGVIIVVLIIYNLIKLQMADEQEKGPIRKNIKTVLVVGVVIMSASALLKLLFSYFSSAAIGGATTGGGGVV